MKGDLFEARKGGIESGFYRKPFDFSSFVPSDSALNTLDKAVLALKDLLERKKLNIVDIETELIETQEEITKLAETLGKLESEIKIVQQSITNSKTNIQLASNKILNKSDLLKKGKETIRLCELEKQKVKNIEGQLQRELKTIKQKLGFFLFL